MSVPTSDEVFSYGPTDLPVVSSDPAQAKPIGVGSVAVGGNTVDVRVDIGPFGGPVDVSFVIYAPALDSDDLYFMDEHDTLKRLSRAVDEDEHQAQLTGNYSSDENDHGARPSRKFGRLISWRNNVVGVNEDVFTRPTSDLAPGVYTLVLVVRAHGDDDNYYRWVTHVTIP